VNESKAIRYDLVIRQVTIKQAQNIVKYCIKKKYILAHDDIEIGLLKEVFGE